MEKENKRILNEFLVETFNLILVGEERAIAKRGVKNLSMREMHVISAVADLEIGNRNTMSNVAERLFISAGALTTAVNVLIKKGYLERTRSEEDRRLVLVTLTGKGREVHNKHEEFHEVFVNYIVGNLKQDELSVLAKSLKSIRDLTHKFVYEEEKK